MKAFTAEAQRAQRNAEKMEVFLVESSVSLCNLCASAVKGVPA